MEALASSSIIPSTGEGDDEDGDETEAEAEEEGEAFEEDRERERGADDIDGDDGIGEKTKRNDKEQQQKKKKKKKSVSLLGVVRFLRRERDRLELALDVVKQEKGRWERRATEADRQLTKARRDVDAALAREHQSHREGTHQTQLALDEHVQQAALLRESNAALRREVASLQAKLTKDRSASQAMEARVAPLEKELMQLKAAHTALGTEVEHARAAA